MTVCVFPVAAEQYRYVIVSSAGSPITHGSRDHGVKIPRIVAPDVRCLYIATSGAVLIHSSQLNPVRAIVTRRTVGTAASLPAEHFM
jgi:hypothetical protein